METKKYRDEGMVVSQLGAAPAASDLGQSLIEILAALVIVCLLIGSLISVYSPVSLWISHSRWETAAANYGFAMLECLRSQPDQLDESNQGKSAQELGLPCGEPEQNLSSELTGVQPLPDDPNLYHVEVSVQWNQGTETGCIQMSTLIRKPR